MGRNNGFGLPPKLLLRIIVTILCLAINSVHPQERTLTPCELETLIRELTYPGQEYEMHAASLRSQLRNLLESGQIDNYQSLDDQPIADDGALDDKRSLSSLAREGMLRNGKRNIGALARAGALRGGMMDEIKRSIATLAKNGQLPSREPDAEVSSSASWMDDKRNIGSLARSGFYGGSTGKRNIASLARSFELPSYGKRNIASLVRSRMLPSQAPKRSLASLARTNMLPSYGKKSYDGTNEDKRNIGAVARDWALPNHQTKMNEKRETHSDKGNRQKRQAFYGDFGIDVNDEVPEPVLQASAVDYDDLLNALNEINPNFDQHTEDKRYLGSIMRSGWNQYRPQSGTFNNMEKRHIGSLARLGMLRSDIDRSYNQKPVASMYRQEQTEKRHIGALARSGWLPAFRPARGGRFSRSGRARSRTDGFYLQPEQLRQPIAGGCRRCDSAYTNTISWGAPGLQSGWGTPPRLTALHWRSLRAATPTFLSSSSSTTSTGSGGFAPTSAATAAAAKTGQQRRRTGYY